MTIKLTDLFTSADEIRAAAAEIHEEGKKLDVKIHVMLCSGIVHSHVHGDYQILNDIIGKLSKGLRTNAAKEFVNKFAPVRWNGKKEGFVFDKNKRNEAFADSEAAETMLAKLWVEYRPEPDYKPVDVMKQFDSMIKRITTDMEKNPAISEEQVRMLNAFKEQMAAQIQKEQDAAIQAQAEAALADAPAEEEAA